jgi:hypothetical protein
MVLARSSIRGLPVLGRRRPILRGLSTAFFPSKVRLLDLVYERGDMRDRANLARQLVLIQKSMLGYGYPPPPVADPHLVGYQVQRRELVRPGDCQIAGWDFGLVASYDFLVEQAVQAEILVTPIGSIGPGLLALQHCIWRPQPLVACMRLMTPAM